MEESKDKLRMQFEAETDIIVEAHPDVWKKYALWLEDLSIKDLNNEVIRLNKYLRDKVHQVIELLNEG